MLRVQAVFAIVFTAASVVSHGQAISANAEIRVKLLDYKTGRPVQRHVVELMLPDQTGEIYNRSPRIFQKTSRDGVAVFDIKRPLPPSIWVIADYPCTRKQRFGTSEVLDRGAVGDHAGFPLCANATSSVATAHPGEVVIYIRRLNIWQKFRRLLYETFEG
jgi:hypothetical protein